MSFKTNADTQGAYYGIWKQDKATKTYQFVPLGKKVTIEHITTNIETGDAQLSLSFDYQGEPKHLTVSRTDIGDSALLKPLAAKGADVTRRHFDTLVDTLRLQEEAMLLNGIRTEKVYTHLGWLHQRTFDEDGIETGSILCYRSYTLLGGKTARYDGNYVITPMGSFDVWLDMVKAEVIGNPAMELVLIAGLSAVVNGLIAPITTGENPIIHLCCASSQGKSTALALAASAFGEPFDGERKAYSKTGEVVTRCSIYGSWGATENATIAQCAGNRGAVIVLNELGKFKGNDMSRIVYDLSEGTDKARLNKDMETRKTEGYHTTILSAGEISLLGRCKDKLEGLQNRVMEIEKPLTTSAENSRNIKDVCRKHNGWAAPKLAQYILDNGGVNLVMPIYDSFRQELDEKLPDSPSKERFIEKFAALFMTTAVLATAALNIPFSLDGLIAFLADYETEKGKERNVAASSYDAVIEACRINKRSFYINGESDPVVKSFGRIKYPNRLHDDGRTIVEEYEIRRDFLEDVLKKNGFPNIRTCARAWKTMDVLDYEVGRLTRSRKIDEYSEATEDVFVFRVFGDQPVQSKSQPKSQLVKLATKSAGTDNEKGDKTLSFQMAAMLREDGDEDDEDADPT